MARPIVFLTDYGLADGFVGICHGVMARLAPEARVIDLTHAIPRQDVLRGALALGRATDFMPTDAVYVAVVDPGVGSERRSVAVRAGSGATLVGPDNGLLSMAWEALGGAEAAAEIAAEDVVLHPVSKTSHGRDVFAPAAAHLANGLALERMGPAVEPAELRVVELAAPMLSGGVLGCRVTGIDGFGNVQLNARPADLEEAGIGRFLRLAGRAIPRVQIFAELPEGTLGAIVDSEGYVALVVNRGSAAAMLGLAENAVVVLE
jgi:S-adenosylmethionine hydrolase